jgi:hypothetical protein
LKKSYLAVCVQRQPEDDGDRRQQLQHFDLKKAGAKQGDQMSS